MNRIDVRKALLPVAVVYVGLIVQIAAFHGHYHDDAFITFRYGANLASGLGLVFNENERVMGSTSPGQSLVSAAMCLIAGHDNLPDVMIAVGCIGWLLQSVALFFLLRPPLGGIGAGFIALAIAAGAANSHAWVSLETNGAAALSLFAIVAGARSRWNTAALLCAGAGFMRPDAFLLAPLLAIPCLIEIRTRAWGPSAVFIACALPWFLFASWYFGSPLPQSAVTKFQNVGVAEYGVHLLTYPAKSPVIFTGISVFTTVVVWLLAIVGGVILVKRKPILGILCAFGVFHLLAYLYLRPFTMHVWHLYPGTMILTVLCLVPPAATYRWAKDRAPLRYAALAVMSLIAAGYGVRTYRASMDYAVSYWGGSRHNTYVGVVEYLHRHAAGDDVVAAVEVGTIGYLSGMTMYDLGGLITEQPSLSRSHADWLVLDAAYVRLAPSSADLKEILGSGDFRAFIFRLDSD